MKFELYQNMDPERLPPKILQQILQDPVLMEKLSDRVYELLQAELQQQRERNYGYGRRF